MTPLARMVSLPLLALALAQPVSAQQDQPASKMPADVFAYLEVDAGALDRGLHQLDLVQLVDDPEFASFFEPLFAMIGADPDHPVDSLLANVPISQFLAGHAAIGIRGFRIWVEQPDGTQTEVEISPDSPLNVRAMLDLAGMVASMRMDMTMSSMGLMSPETASGWFPEELNVEVGVDMVLVIQPGPALRQHVHEVLSNPQQIQGPVIDIHNDDILGRSVTHVSFSIEQTRGVVTDLYADLAGDTWVIATNLETFEQAVTGSPADSLAANPDFIKVHERMTSGDPVLFAYGNTGDELSILQNFIPPVLDEANSLLGFDSYVGSGFALSMTEGGVRESFGVVFDGEPRGVFSLLDAMPGGIAMAHQAPADAVALVGMKFDPAILHDRFLALIDTLLPGTGKRVGTMMAAGFSQTGFDLQRDFLNAFGDEISLVQFAPTGPMIPDWLMSVEVKDEEAARLVLARVQGMMAGNAPLRFVAAELDGGIAAQTIEIENFPIMAPTMAIANGKLMIASTSQVLVDAATGWGNGATIASSEVYQRTMRGLARGDDGSAVMLVYADLRQIVPPVLMMTMGLIPEQFADTGAAPEMEYWQQHLSGVALAIRNDSDGLTLDTFSPLGVMMPMIGVGLVFAQGVPSSRPAISSGPGFGPETGPETDESFITSANDLNTQAWFMVRYADQGASSYQAGLDLSQRATSMEPQNHWFLNTLGVAQYRTGAYSQALETLKRCEAMNRSSSNQYDASSDVLFMAMCHYRLGHQEVARELLDRAGNMVGPGSDEEINTFYDEAMELIRK